MHGQCRGNLDLAGGIIKRMSSNHSRENWPQLESLRTVDSIVNKAEVEAVTQIEWPNLRILWICFDTDAIQAVMQGNWPQLRDLELHNIAFDDGFQRLSGCTWNSLERLHLRNSGMTAWTIGVIVEAH